jgi:hypothetical protein
VSPRGDTPGFARVLDDHTIAIPDRPGNNRLDTMSNIVADAEIGLLFFIPGIDETLRVNGTARVSGEPAPSWRGRHQRARAPSHHSGHGARGLSPLRQCTKARPTVARRLPPRPAVLPIAGTHDRRTNQASRGDCRAG